MAAKYRKVRGSVEEQRQYEQLLADAKKNQDDTQKNRADIDYVAMMNDIDLDEGDEEEEVE